MRKIKEMLVNADRLLLLLIIVGTGSFLLRMYNITAPIANDLYHNFRTSETAIVIQNFFRDGFSLFNSSMPVFGKPWTVMFEFPTYQAIVYGIMKLFHATNIDLFGRITSVITFYICTLFLVKFVKLLINKHTAYIVGIIYMLSMYNVYWSRAVLIDYMSVLFSIIYMYCMYKWLIGLKRKFTYVIGLIFGILGYITKATSMFVVVFFMAFLIVEYEIRDIWKNEGTDVIGKIGLYIKQNKLRLFLLGIIAIIPVVFGYLWTRYADAMKGLSVYTATLTSNSLHGWNYGTMQQKINLNNWKVIGSRHLAFFGGKYILFGTIICYFLVAKKKFAKYVIYSCIAQILTVFCLFNLFYRHNYYLITLTPFVYLAFGIMLHEIFNELSEHTGEKKLIVTVISMVLIIAQIKTNKDYISGVMNISKDNTNVGIFVNKITNNDELILITDEDWSPVTLYNADRKGFMITDEELLQDTDFHAFIKDDNYTTLVTHQLDKANAFLNIYSCLEQYPIDNNGLIGGAQSIFVYKFNDDLLNDMDLSNEVIINSDDFYDIDTINMDNPVIICYNVDENVALDVNIVDMDGVSHNCKITLLKDAESIYINFGEVCKSIDSIQILLGEVESVKIKY